MFIIVTSYQNRDGQQAQDSPTGFHYFLCQLPKWHNTSLWNVKIHVLYYLRTLAGASFLHPYFSSPKINRITWLLWENWTGRMHERMWENHYLLVPQIFIGCLLCWGLPDAGYAVANKTKLLLCSGRGVKQVTNWICTVRQWAIPSYTSRTQ